MNKKKKYGILRLLEISGEKKTALIISGLLSITAAVLQTFPFIAVYKIIREYIEKGIPDQHEILLWSAVAAGSVFISMLLSAGTFTISHVCAFRILHNLRIKIAEHLAVLPLGYYARVRSGEIKQIFDENVPLIELFIAHKIPEFLMTVAVIIFLGVVFFLIDPILATVSIFIYMLAYWLQIKIYSDHDMKKEISVFFDVKEKISASAVEFVRGLPVLKMFSHSAESFQGLRDTVMEYRNHALSFAVKGSRGFILFTILMNCSMFFIFPVVMARYSGVMDTDFQLIMNAVFFTILSNAVLPPMLKIMNIGGTMMTIIEGISRIDLILAEQPLPVPEHPQQPEGNEIEFKNVSFSYQGRDRTVENISFTVKEGQTLAIVGPSGSGKSTLLALAARFYDPASGTVMLGGVDLRQMTEESIMNKTSIVFQNSFMFRDTLRENIRAGKKDATDEEIMKAVRLAECTEIVEKIGLDTVIGEGGTELSGGEQQRINIARSILKNAPVLLLDEISSALDPHNQLKIVKALENLKKGKTQIIVAHRLESIINADHIALLDSGRIIAAGTHESLMQNCAEYREMWKLYQETISWKITERMN
ncbi:MAG: ABC transporter ATP-binding protein/permease [Succinivibrionaceae bacterium]|nr:ABC transporter ATP-binding protein/permease [Succinivibrionaceae bacterium]